jgi:hypothetical protein
VKLDLLRLELVLCVQPRSQPLLHVPCRLQAETRLPVMAPWASPDLRNSNPSHLICASNSFPVAFASSALILPPRSTSFLLSSTPFSSKSSQVALDTPRDFSWPPSPTSPAFNSQDGKVRRRNGMAWHGDIIAVTQSI